MKRERVLRFPTIVIVAMLVNALMFGVIQYMVINRDLRLGDTTNFDIANFIRMQEQSREVRSRRDPKAPEKPDMEAQQDISRLVSATKGGGVGGLAVNLPSIDIDVDVGGGVQIARELTPLVRVPPEYPERARISMVQGEVLLRFTVTETGSVADPEVMRSDPPGYFDRAAIRAVLRWKYQPQLVDGRPVSVITYTRIVFKMAEGQ
ncbi:MAG: energy transducer TonB [Gammaproteobacteria bacterium]|nr:energy transducer TonB [Gammaproteobacteria bacterium]MDH4314134.1 energy transducer TonB [Gammaproteobacteria bacterium]MDH5212774.1 energy transducer TonB [Gammaproteobacteria bacterium]MDH5501281.1 energy transducer TonB [Gammaproteobacteria bacterium]